MGTFILRLTVRQWVLNQIFLFLQPPDDPEIWEGYYRIDSVQNGLLLNNYMHGLWDRWMLSINPVSFDCNCANCVSGTIG
jgi:hypothetical protein